jgi:hypothetical protein
MKWPVITLTLFLLSSLPAHAQISHSTWNQGAVRVGASATACDSSAIGAIRYNSTGTVMQYCNGSAWTTLSSGGGGSPGGGNLAIQFNSGGTFGGDNDLYWSGVANQLHVGNSSNGEVVINALAMGYSLTLSPNTIYFVEISTSDSSAINFAGTSISMTLDIPLSGFYTPQTWGAASSVFNVPFRGAPPAAQTIAAGSIITDNACGSMKQISSAGAVTTSTTNTFTPPAAGNSGCCMDVVNTGANNITLDANTNFKTIAAADQVLGQFDVVRVCSNGSFWHQVSAIAANN